MKTHPSEYKPNSSDEALSEIQEAVTMCLECESKWRQYHKNMIRSAQVADTEASSHLLNIAEFEYKVLFKYRQGYIDEACKIIQEIINTGQKEKLFSLIDKAWYFQIQANLVDSVDPTQAIDIQINARNLHGTLLKPQNYKPSKLTRTKSKQADAIVQWLANFNQGTDVFIAIHNFLSNLIYSEDVKSKPFEQCVSDIGSFLGFNTQMPDADNKNGPDILWSTEEGIHFIIEVKNRSKQDKISCEAGEQLLHSI